MRLASGGARSESTGSLRAPKNTGGISFCATGAVVALSDFVKPRLLGTLLSLALLVSVQTNAGQRSAAAGAEPGTRREREARAGRSLSAAESRQRHLALERALQSIDFQTIFRSPPVTARQAKRLLARVGRTLDADFRLDWNSPSGAISYQRGQPIVVPRGLVQSPGMTIDGLTLILAHEAEHRHGHRSEARADYGAVRHGLRALWGENAFAGRAPKRPLLAVYSALQSQFGKSLDLSLARPNIVIEPTGYPTVQSRWEIMEAAVAGCGLPALPKRLPDGEPELLGPTEAARYLGLSVKRLRQLARTPGGPVELDFNGLHYEKSDLDSVRAQLEGRPVASR